MNIVLAHGILGFGTLFGVEYFRGVKAFLEANLNAAVLVPEVSPVESVAHRAGQLREKIELALTNGSLKPGEKIHIIAHSMGGLDGRYLLATDTALAEQTATLTTLGTPHHGTPIADLAYGTVSGGGLLSKEQVEAVAGAAGLSLAGLRDLTTQSMAEFNLNYADNPQVKYFCGAGRGHDRPPQTCEFLWLFHTYLKNFQHQENDGLVPVSSALRTGWQTIGEPWPADHFELIGHTLGFMAKLRHGNFEHLSRYAEIVEAVKSVG
ncbi:esterase/lipase family protein [Methylomagnum sp.]